MGDNRETAHHSLFLAVAPATPIGDRKKKLAMAKAIRIPTT
jgi:hypothetical protein